MIALRVCVRECDAARWRLVDRCRASHITRTCSGTGAGRHECKRPYVPLLEVNALKKHFPLQAGSSAATTAYVYAVDGVTFTVSTSGETLSIVGRERLRQVDGREDDPAADRSDRRRDLPRRQAHRQISRRASCGRCAGACRSCSRTRSAASIRRQRVRDIIAEPMVNFGSGEEQSREIDDRVAALMDKVRLPRDAMRPLPARVLRRPAPAHRHRARARARLGPDHLRRGGLRARRFGEGADRQPAVGPAGRTWPGAAVHQPRPRDRRAPDASRRGDVSRQDRRTHRPAHAVRHGRTIPTRARCCPPFRCRTRWRSASGSSCAATCRARSTRRAAAASTRAARTSRTSAAARSRNCATSAPVTSRPATSICRWTRERYCRRPRDP